METIGEVLRGYSAETAVIPSAAVRWRYVIPMKLIYLYKIKKLKYPMS